MVMNNRIMRDKAQEERAQIYHNLHSALVEFYRMFKEDDQTLAHAHLHISRLVAEVTDEILDTWDDDDSENPDSWNDPNG